MKSASLKLTLGTLLFCGTLLGIPGDSGARAGNNPDLHPFFGDPKGPQRVFALGGDNTFIHDVGLLKLRISNIGTMGNRYEVDKFGASWLGGEYLHVSGLWIGAIGGDARKHVSTAQYDTELLPEIDELWNIYPSVEGASGGARISAYALDNADDDHDDSENEDFLNGLDDDGDGLIDEDYEAISSQMFSCMYRDDTAEALAFNSEHFPLNLLIKQRSFQWSAPTINEFVGFDFEIINNGDQRLRKVHVGFFVDSDAGPRSNPQYFTDDLVGWVHVDTLVHDPLETGFCSTRQLSFDAVVTWDAPDDGNLAQGGDVPGVFGSLFLGHTTDRTGLRAPPRVNLNTVAWFSSQGEDTDPRNDIERYDLMSSGTKPLRAATKPEDYRYVMSAGEFARLDPGESLTFQTAHVVGDGFSGFRRNAAAAQRVFNGAYIDKDRDSSTGSFGQELCLQILEVGEVIFWTDPCDTLAIPPHKEEIKRVAPCVYVEDDCDPCTGIEGREFRYNWVGINPPPLPLIELEPGNQQITVRWDNSPERHVNSFTGQPLFAGYQIWRSDTWKRPAGSIGPEASEFRKLMTLWWVNSTLGLPPSNFVTNTPASRLLADYRNSEVLPLEDDDPLDDFVPYPTGIYEFTDDSGITNGVVSFYVVTAFAITLNDLGIPTIFGPVPSSREEFAVLARADAQANVDCDEIYAVPNPYRGHAEWDLGPNQDDPTGTKIALVGLPQGTSTVRIYTMAGDLVKSAVHEDTAIAGGTYWWDLVTHSGQDAVSGVYLFTVQYDGGVCRGKFLLIR